MIKLQPGDYVSTEGMTEEQYNAVCKAFMEAGAGKGEYDSYLIWRDYDYVGYVGETTSTYTQQGYCVFHFDEGAKNNYFNRKRELTIDQILNKEDNTMDLQEAYRIMQNNCGIEVGDTVKVLRGFSDNEGGNTAEWHPNMEGTINSVGKVIGINRGVTVSIRVEIQGSEWSYPFFVLGLVKKAPKLPNPVRISGQYKAEFKEDGSIAVGCQTLNFDMIEKIYLTAKRMK